MILRPEFEFGTDHEGGFESCFWSAHAITLQLESGHGESLEVDLGFGLDDGIAFIQLIQFGEVRDDDIMLPRVFFGREAEAAENVGQLLQTVLVESGHGIIIELECGRAVLELEFKLGIVSDAQPGAVPIEGLVESQEFETSSLIQFKLEGHGIAKVRMLIAELGADSDEEPLLVLRVSSDHELDSDILGLGYRLDFERKEIDRLCEQGQPQREIRNGPREFFRPEDF